MSRLQLWCKNQTTSSIFSESKTPMWKERGKFSSLWESLRELADAFPESSSRLPRLISTRGNYNVNNAELENLLNKRLKRSMTSWQDPWVRFWSSPSNRLQHPQMVLEQTGRFQRWNQSSADLQRFGYQVERGHGAYQENQVQQRSQTLQPDQGQRSKDQVHW